MARNLKSHITPHILLDPRYSIRAQPWVFTTRALRLLRRSHDCNDIHDILLNQSGELSVLARGRWHICMQSILRSHVDDSLSCSYQIYDAKIMIVWVRVPRSNSVYGRPVRQK